MALSSTVHWDVRVGGNNANGGGFNFSSTGTDYTQRDTPQVVYTDLVIGGTNTNLTSAANPFTSAHVGNVINITGGTGFTTGRYEIMSVAGSTATMDRAVGTASSTGGTGNLGGGLQTLQTAHTARVAGNVIWLKTGTYTLTVEFGTTTNVSVYGYGTAHGDNGRATVTTATDSINLFQFSAGGVDEYSFRNLDLTNTATTKGNGFQNNNFNGPPFLSVSNCTLTGFNEGIVATNNSMNITLDQVSIVNSVSRAINFGAGFLRAYGCNFKGTTSSAVVFTNTGGGRVLIFLVSCLITGSAQEGIKTDSAGGDWQVVLINCTVAGNTLHGIHSGAATANVVYPGYTVLNSVIYGNGGYGWNMSVASVSKLCGFFSYANAFGGNTSGARNNVPAGIGEITLTANPFTNSAGGDYTLNNTAGGGALCRGAGYPNPFPGT